VAVAVLAVISCAAAVLAAGDQVRISVALANVREAATTDSAVAFQAHRGETFRVIEAVGDWLLIEGEGQRRGYVFKGLVASSEATGPLTPAPRGDSQRTEKAGVSIQHERLGCALAGQYPRLEACLSPAEAVGRAQVHFRAVETDPWYAVDLKPDGDCYVATLPKPSGTISSFHYYLFAIDRQFDMVDRPEGAPSQSYGVRVIEHETDCGSTVGRVARSVKKSAGGVVVSVVRSAKGALLDTSAAQAAEAGATLTGFSPAGVTMASTGAAPAASTAASGGGSASAVAGGVPKAYILGGVAAVGAAGVAVAVATDNQKPSCSAQQIVEQLMSAAGLAGYRYFARDNDTICLDLAASIFGDEYGVCTALCVEGVCGGGQCSEYFLRSDSARQTVYDWECPTGTAPVSEFQQTQARLAEVAGFCGL